MGYLFNRQRVAGSFACSGRRLLRSLWSRWVWCPCSIEMAGLCLSLPRTAPALHLLWCFMEPWWQFKSQNLQRAAWKEQSDQQQEQSLAFSGWQGTRVGAWEEQILSSNPLAFPLWCNSNDVIFLLHLNIALWGLQILQKPEVACISSYLPVQAAFSI